MKEIKKKSNKVLSLFSLIKKWRMIILFAALLMILPYTILRKHYSRERLAKDGQLTYGVISEKHRKQEVSIVFFVQAKKHLIRVKVPDGARVLSVNDSVRVRYLSNDPYECEIIFDDSHSVVY